MAADWPDDIPTTDNTLRASFRFIPPERVIQSQTDSGKARSRKVFTASPYKYAGVIRMLQADMLTFVNWRDGIGGAAFNWTNPMIGGAILARFVPGEQGDPTWDPQVQRWAVPYMIEAPV